MNDKEKYELKKLWELNPDFYKRSEADKKKYGGEENLKRLNQQTLEEMKRKIEQNKRDEEKRKEDFWEVVKKDFENFYRRKYFTLK